MNNVLITGGAGFIGSNFIRFLLQIDPKIRITNLDALTYAGSLSNLQELPDPSRHKFIRGDICDRELVTKIMLEHKIDTAIHFAAETHVDRSILGPERFIQTNVMGTFTLLDVALRTWKKVGLLDSDLTTQFPRFHHISTDEVFGSLGPEDPPWSEITPYAPNSPYAASKAASDHLVRSYGHTYGLPYTITNCSNNFGPHQFPEKLIPLIILNAISGQSLPIYGDGKQIRDWLYVEDHCEAIWTVLKTSKSGKTYNIGGNNQPHNIAVVQMICDILDELKPDSPYQPHSSLIKYVEDRPGHDRRYAMDISKIQQELGWKPRHTLSEALIKTVEWYIQHPDWIESIRKESGYQDWLDKNYTNRGDET